MSSKHWEVHIHQLGNSLLSEEQGRTFLNSYGVSEADFNKAYKSFTVDSAIRTAESMQKESAVLYIPSMLINGKYLITVTESVPSHAEMLEVVDYLIAKEKAELGL